MKTKFITGTTSGIGLATAHLLDKPGWIAFYCDSPVFSRKINRGGITS
ncbi:MAG: hypothetical protein ACPG7F_11225 [Aggregatilineales bacterium]